MRLSYYLATELNIHGIHTNVNRLLAKMELDFEKSRQPLEVLPRSALKRRNVGDVYDAFYSDRANHALSEPKARDISGHRFEIPQPSAFAFLISVV